MTFYTFANATTAIPLSNLDANFATPITLGNTAVTINGTFSSIGNLTLNNATIASGNATVTKITAPTHDAGSGNALTLQSNSTTGLYIDTSQNVGIGTSSPTAYGTHKTLAINGAAGVVLDMLYNGTRTGSIVTESADVNILNITSGPLRFSTNATEQMRIDSSGNVGIGTTSPGAKLNVNGTGAFGGVSGTAACTQIGNNGTINYIQSLSSTSTGYNLAFYQGGSEVMRIDTSGNLLVGTTSSLGGLGARLNVDSGGARGIVQNITSTSPGRYQEYLYSGSTVGFISTNGTSTTYSTSSDYRLKENVTPMTTGLATIGALKPVNYDWISDKSEGEGFIAHELQAVIPHAVTGDKDALNKDGSIKPQGVDYSKIVVHLVAALQELDAKFEAYKASHP